MRGAAGGAETGTVQALIRHRGARAARVGLERRLI
jgi:hypothetical protein